MVNNGKSIELKKNMGWHLWNMCRYIEWNIHTYTKSLKKESKATTKKGQQHINAMHKKNRSSILHQVILKKTKNPINSPKLLMAKILHQFIYKVYPIIYQVFFTSQVFFGGFLPSTSYLSKKFLPVFQAIFRFQDFIIFQMLSPWPGPKILRPWDPRVWGT